MDVRELLAADLKARRLSQVSLLRMLAPDGEPPMKASNVAMWKRRNAIPQKHIESIIRILGPESEIAKAYGAGVLPIDPYPGYESIRKASDMAVIPEGYDKKELIEDLKEMGVGDETPIQNLSFVEACLYDVRQRGLAPHPPFIAVGSILMIYDYISPKVVCKIWESAPEKEGVPPTMHQVYKRLFQLTVAQKLDGANPRKYLMIVKATREDERQMDMLKKEAGLTEIQLFFTDSSWDAAKIILAAEGRTI